MSGLPKKRLIQTVVRDIAIIVGEIEDIVEINPDAAEGERSALCQAETLLAESLDAAEAIMEPGVP